MKKLIIIFIGCLVVLSNPISIVEAISESAEHNEEIHVMTDDDFIPIYEEYIGAEHSELLDYGYYVDDSYDLIYDFKDEGGNEELRWWRETDDNSNTIRLYFEDYRYVCGEMILPSCDELTVRIPDTVNGATVTEFYRSGAFKSFDVNPRNKYFKSDGQTVFSKDGKTLLSYAQFDPSTHYSIPKGTQTIRTRAFSNCDILKSIYIPSSVSEIEPCAFAHMNSLKNIVFESFRNGEIKIDKSILGYQFDVERVRFTCSESVDLNVMENTVKWQCIDGVQYYEIYQKLNNGKYKLIKTTTKSSCKFTTIKSGSTYTFAVKPVAVIPAANYNKETDEYEINGKTYQSYSETFTIEGTMSEDVVICGE